MKIIYQEDEYLTSGKNVIKLKRLDVQPIKDVQFEFFIAVLSNDYLQPLKPSSGFDFCEHLTFSPVLIRNIKTDKFSFIDVIKDELFLKITNEYKEADFFQSGSNYKIYDKITKIEKTDNDYVLMIRHDGVNYNVLISENKGGFKAKYNKL